MDDLTLTLELHVGLVKQIAGYYQRRSAGRADFDDLYQAGVCGLIHAARHFDASRGLKFSTYAGKCIKGSVIEELKRVTDFVRIPDNVTGEERARLADLMRPQRLARDRRSKERDGLGDVIDERAAVAQMEAEEAEETRARVERLMQGLDERKRMVVERRLEGKKLREVAEEMGCTRSRVQQLEAKAHGRMRRAEAGRAE